MSHYQLYKRKRSYIWFVGVLISVLIFGILVVGIQSFSKNTYLEQYHSLEKALQRNIVQCYALEGQYPESLDYLKEHYGLVYNEDLFYVDYQPIAKNIKPSISILYKE